MVVKILFGSGKAMGDGKNFRSELLKDQERDGPGFTMSKNGMCTSLLEKMISVARSQMAARITLVIGKSLGGNLEEAGMMEIAERKMETFLNGMAKLFQELHTSER